MQKNEKDQPYKFQPVHTVTHTQTHTRTHAQKHNIIVYNQKHQNLKHRISKHTVKIMVSGVFMLCRVTLEPQPSCEPDVARV